MRAFPFRPASAGDLLREWRLALRALARTPGYTAVAAVTLAVGIAASTAAFSLLDAIVLHPLPYPEPDRLVFLSGTALTSDTFPEWQQRTSSYEAMAAVDPGVANVVTADGPEPIRSLIVSRHFVSLLGLRPSAGRLLIPDDFRTGASAVISNRLAIRLFGSERAAVGRVVHLTDTGYHNESYEVVGTVSSIGPLPYDDINLVLPLRPMPRANLCPAVARLKTGTTIEQARAEADSIARAMTAARVPRRGVAAVEVANLKDRVLGDSKLTVQLVFLASLLVFAVTCANVAHLVLARSTARAREIALRLALGASRGRLCRELLVENAVVSLFSAAAGVSLSAWAVKLLIAFIPYQVPRLEEAHTSTAVLVFAVLVAVLTSLGFAVAPLFYARSLDLHRSLKEGSRQVAGGGHQRWLRSALVVSEIAVTCVVLVVAGLLLQTFLSLSPDNPGFNPHQKLILHVGNTRGTSAQSVSLVNDAQIGVGSLPGVQAVAAATDLPMTGMSWVPDIRIGSQTIAGGNADDAVHCRSVTANYLPVMGVSVAAGRGLLSSDDAQKLPVVVVNQEFVRRFLGAADPLGQRLAIAGGGPQELGELTIVGVVANGRIFGNEAGSRPEMYLPFSVAPTRGFWLVVATSGDPLAGARDVRRVVSSVAPNATVTEMQTFDQQLARSVAQPRFNALLLGILAGLAVVLALAGIYAVMSYSVAQRTHEMGVRIALGARGADVLGAVIGSALRFAAIGIPLGAAGALAVGRAMRAILFGIVPTDPRSYLIAAGLLCLLTLVASYVPARRATRIDPMTALRSE